jgi:hypothetical protein
MKEAAYPSAWATRTPVGAGWEETPPMLKVMEKGALREASRDLFELVYTNVYILIPQASSSN